MKSIIYIIITGMVWGLLSCNKMDSIYQEYIVPNGIIYPGKVLKPLVYAGKNRVKIAWLRGADPSIVKAKIFWNNFSDSVEIEIPPTADTISRIIDNLPEKSYSFMIRTYDNKGNSSVTVELMGAAYGEKYQANLLNRPVILNTLDLLGKATINWGGADLTNGAYKTEVRYTDISGNIKNLFFPVIESTLTISDLKPGTGFQYRTMFKPDSLCIDEFMTGYSGSGYFSYDKKDWKIIAYSSQFDATTSAAVNFIDGSAATRWHTKTSGVVYPHYITIDMGAQRTIAQFGVWRSTYGTQAEWERAPDKIQFLVSSNNLTWTDLGIFNFNRFSNDEQVYKMLTLPGARYIKFVAVAGPLIYMGIGDISAYGI